MGAVLAAESVRQAAEVVVLVLDVQHGGDQLDPLAQRPVAG
jgi:hypothetical protein